MNIDIHNLTNEKIRSIMDKYKRDKEYRRIYYKNKYHTDCKYKEYIKDYNKIRYENNMYIKNIGEGVEEDKALESRANKLFKYYAKQNRFLEFKEKFSKESEIVYNLNVKNITYK